MKKTPNPWSLLSLFLTLYHYLFITIFIVMNHLQAAGYGESFPLWIKIPFALIILTATFTIEYVSFICVGAGIIGIYQSQKRKQPGTSSALIGLFFLTLFWILEVKFIGL